LQPEFSRKISKSSLVVRPVTVEILTAVLTSLKHLLRQHLKRVITILVSNVVSPRPSLYKLNGNEEKDIDTINVMETD